jgi:hypothetical protein
VAVADDVVTADAVTAAAIESLAALPNIAGRVSKDRVANAVKAAWPNPPAPLVYMLWIASSPYVGREPAQSQLNAVEEMLGRLDHGKPVSGTWQRA